MSLYNQIFGRNPFAGILLSAIGLRHEDIARFRDCHLSQDRKHVIVLTRTGGGNREHYRDGNALLETHPLYVRDQDDEFDPTYAMFEFHVPVGVREALASLPQDAVRAESFGVVFQQFMDKLRAGEVEDPNVKRAIQVAEHIADQLAEGKTKIEV